MNTKIRHKHYLLILATMPTFISCGSNVEYKVIISVHDGDTFTDSANNIYRLYGIDTPELNHNWEEFKETSGLERYWATKSTKYVKKIILYKKVSINVITIDPYKRKVARININQKDLSIELLKQGLARVAYISQNKSSKYFTADTNYYDKLYKAQHLAIKNKKGIWNDMSLISTIFPKQKIIA